MRGMFSILNNVPARRQIYEWTPDDCKTFDYFIGTLGPVIFIVFRLSDGRPVAVDDTLPRAQARMYALQLIHTLRERTLIMSTNQPKPRKRYHGERSPQGAARVTVTNLDTNVTEVLDPAASQRVFNHSPDGFEWGYGGSGPAQLALGLLLDHFGEDLHAFCAAFQPEDQAPRSLRCYQQFKARVISTFGEEWEIWTEDIDREVEAIEGDAAQGRADAVFERAMGFLG